MALTLPGPILAGSKPSAPARSAPAVHSSGGGMMRAPGSAGGGVHVPGSMGGGAAAPHIPGSMGGGPHVPGSMAGGAGGLGGAHLPSSMAGTAHVPRSISPVPHVPSRPATIVSHPAPALSHVAGGTRPEPARPPEAHLEPHGPARAVPAASHDHVAEHRSGPATVIRSHGRLILAGAAMGAGGAAAAHAYMHPELHANMARDHADVDRDRAFVHAHEALFHTRRVRDFDRHELEAWRRGGWHDEWHYGRRGWWWQTDGVWYPYDDPIYPYPLVVAPLQVYETTQDAGPDSGRPPGDPGTATSQGGPPPGSPAATYGQSAPGAQVASITPLPAPPPGWYRCGEPVGYYPSVGACNGPWTLVQEAPPGGQ